MQKNDIFCYSSQTDSSRFPMSSSLIKNIQKFSDILKKVLDFSAIACYSIQALEESDMRR